MKKIAILLVAVLLVVLMPVPVRAVGGVIENTTWELDLMTGELNITGQGEMNLGDYPGFLDYDDVIKKVIIHEGITSVAYSAFSDCEELEEVVLPESLRSIGKYAFHGCRKLERIDLTHVTSISDYAFWDCGLTEVRIPDAITSIESGVFLGCKQLREVFWHDGITSIGRDTFHGCVSLRVVNLPDSVQTLGTSAFYGCTGLVDLRLNEGLRILGNLCFFECDGLETVSIPDSVESIDSHALGNCDNLREVIIGAGVSEIGEFAFLGSKNLSALTLSSENRSFSVDQGVLYNADKTELLMMPTGFTGAYVIPDGTTSIRSWACRDSMVSELTIPGSVVKIGKYAFNGCRSLEKVTLHDGIQVVGLGAFIESSIKEITIPQSVTLISDQTFGHCWKLRKITFEGAPPEIGTYAFIEVTADVYYPGHTAKGDEVWGSYGGRLEWYPYCTGIHVPVADTIKSPTCTQNGLVGETRCRTCGELLAGQQEIPATGHDFGDWVVDRLPTTQREGLEIRTCSTCGAEEQRKLEKLPPPPTEPVEPDPPSEPTEPDLPTEPSEPDFPMGPSEPDVPSEPTEPDLPSQPNQQEPSVPAETEPDVPPVEAKPSNRKEPDGVRWKAVLGAAAVSLVIGLAGAGTFFVLKKKRR